MSQYTVCFCESTDQDVSPDFELKEILTGKYGEDSKLIYDLADQGGELCSLRYDLTVPFARFLAMNPDISQIKRYHIAKVHRRDQPAMNKGRMREFYQCDFDIAGLYDAMMPDAEIIKLTCDTFQALGWEGRYTIKINHRKILDGIFQVCGVPEDKLRTISSAVDKLDKSPWSEVRREMTEEKGLEAEVADRIGEYAVQKGGLDLLEKLQKDDKLMANDSAKAGLADMALLFKFLQAPRFRDRISFDMSLARGLDYYTGVIYEVVTEGSAPQQPQGEEGAKKESRPKKSATNGDGDDDRSNDPTIGVGSVAAGGRYDNLVGMFSGKQQIPCVGISFGVERIFSITKQRLAADSAATSIRTSATDVFVMAFGGKGFEGLFVERAEIADRLRAAGVNTEYALKMKPKLPQQFKEAETKGIPFAVILGDEELAAGKCRIKEMGLPSDHPEKDGVLVELANVEDEVKQRLARQSAAGWTSTVASR